MAVGPPHRKLDNPMEVCESAVIWNNHATPNCRADMFQDYFELEGVPYGRNPARHGTSSFCHKQLAQLGTILEMIGEEAKKNPEDHVDGRILTQRALRNAEARKEDFLIVDSGGLGWDGLVKGERL